MKNVLITGGAGFIGSNVALQLLNKGYSVRVLDNLASQIHGENPIETSPLFQSIYDKVEFINGSVTDKDVLINAIDNQDAIIHLAAETGTGQSMYEIKRYVDVNIGGTALLLDILTNRKHAVEKVIVASSRAIYGEGSYFCETDGKVYPDLRLDSNMSQGDYNCKCPFCNHDVNLLPTDENSKIHPTSLYGITKHNQESMSMICGKAINLPVVALRYQNVYGPGQSLSNPYTGILSIFSGLLLNGKDVNIFEDGLESRDFVFIDDVVDATVASLEDNDANYLCLNVGSGTSINVKEVATTLTNLYNCKNSKLHISGSYRLGDIRHNLADISLVSKCIKFQPKYSFEEGIKLFAEWVLKQKISNDNSFENSIKEMAQKGLYKSKIRG